MSENSPVEKRHNLEKNYHSPLITKLSKTLIYIITGISRYVREIARVSPSIEMRTKYNG